MSFKRGDKILDLVGDLGVGEIIDIYTNWNDDPAGVEMAVCRFTSTDDGEPPIDCDRTLEEITTDLQAIPAPNSL